MQNTKVCSFCKKSIALDHHTTDERGQSVHASCREEQMMLAAATLQADQWRRNFAKSKTA